VGVDKPELELFEQPQTRPFTYMNSLQTTDISWGAFGSKRDPNLAVGINNILVIHLQHQQQTKDGVR
jgi:hypothetical protein